MPERKNLSGILFSQGRKTVGFSINDRIKIGNYNFDLQTEAKKDKIVGEILFKGKVLKRIEREISDPSKEKEDTFALHKELKELLFLKFQEKGNFRKHSIDENKLKEELLHFLELKEENLKAFLIKEPSIEVFSIFDKNYRNLKIDEWIKALEDEIFSNFIYGFPRMMILPLKHQKELLLIIFLKEGNKFNVVLAVSNIKLSILRKTLYTKKDILKNYLKKLEKNGTN